MTRFTTKTIHRIFTLFLLSYLATWTLAPTFIRHALPDDFIEAVVWGQQFSFGNDKNPWLPAWLAHLGVLLGGESGIGIYFIQALFITIGFIATFQLGRACTNKIYALVGVLIYLGCAGYTVDLQGVNDNYILMGLLPLASLFFYYAQKTNRLCYWLSGSICTALAIMGKYDAALFALAMFFCFITHPRRRFYFTSYPLWLSVLVSFIIILPNCLWLWQHDFQTLRYAFVERAHFAETSWGNQIKNNLIFILSLIIRFLPASLLLLTACEFKNNNNLNTKHHFITHKKVCCAKEDLHFLFWAGAGPILLLLALGFGMNLTLHREWGDTFFGLWGILLLARFQPSISQKSFNRFIKIIFSLLLIWPIGYLFISLQKDTGSYPGKEIARLATAIWHQHYKEPLRYVAGDRYTAGYFALHSPDHPRIFMEWNPMVSPWIDQKKMACHGALFIMDNGHSHQQFIHGDTFPAKIKEKWPNLIILPSIFIPWQRNHTQRPPVKITLGLLPPNPMQCDFFLTH